MNLVMVPAVQMSVSSKHQLLNVEKLMEHVILRKPVQVHPLSVHPMKLNREQQNVVQQQEFVMKLNTVMVQVRNVRWMLSLQLNVVHQQVSVMQLRFVTA